MIRVFKIILLFCIVFGFPIPYIYNSTVLAGILTLAIFSFKKHSLNNFLIIIKSSYIFYLFLLLFIIIVLSLLWPILHQTYDFTIIKTLVNQIVSLFILIIFYSTFYSTSNSPVEIMNDLINIFLIQTFIQIIAFLSPTAKEVVGIFQNKSTIDIANKYEGLRGLALSGGQFFCLSFNYGLIYIIFINYFRVTKQNSIVAITKFIFLIAGTFFAGRTGFIGLLFAIMFLIVSGSNIFKNILLLLKLLAAGTIILTVIFLLLPDTTALFVKKVFPFAFEYFYHFQKSGNLSTTSTHDLFSKMYFPINPFTFLFGDAKYSGLNNHYYMKTDAGYMRQILFYGIIGVLMFIIYQIVMFYKPYKISKTEIKLFNKEVTAKYFFWFLFLYLIVGHVKGEVIGFLIMTQTILLLLFLSYILPFLANQKQKSN